MNVIWYILKIGFNFYVLLFSLSVSFWLSFTPVIKTFRNKNQMHHAILRFLLISVCKKAIAGYRFTFQEGHINLFNDLYPVWLNWSEYMIRLFFWKMHRKDESMIFFS